MGRKVTLSRSEVEMARSMAIPLEQVAKMKLPKRGRPFGSKNKPKSNIDSFAETLKEWDEMEKQVNWEEVAKKQETKLYVYMEENEQIALLAQIRWEEIQRLNTIIGYLEGKIENLAIRGR